MYIALDVVCIIVSRIDMRRGIFADCDAGFPFGRSIGPYGNGIAVIQIDIFDFRYSRCGICLIPGFGFGICVYDDGAVSPDMRIKLARRI